MSKAFAGELAVRATREAIQIFGGNGYSKSMPVEKYGTCPWKPTRVLAPPASIPRIM
jgi:alkylation response protein AidB-like acyl-CoA dehydrogenase